MGAGTDSLHASFRFSVEIEGFGPVAFSECTLPPLEVEVHEQKEGGYNAGTHLLPGRVRAGRVTLKRGLVEASKLLKWYEAVMTGKIKDAQRSVSIILWDSTSRPVMRLDFERAYPVKWSGPTLNAGENTVAVETLELAYGHVSAGTG
jgi:phage tail-like protein